MFFAYRMSLVASHMRYSIQKLFGHTIIASKIDERWPIDSEDNSRCPSSHWNYSSAHILNLLFGHICFTFTTTTQWSARIQCKILLHFSRSKDVYSVLDICFHFIEVTTTNVETNNRNDLRSFILFVFYWKEYRKAHTHTHTRTKRSPDTNFII